MGMTIKDAQLVEQVTGKEKIPVSDGSGLPKAVTTEQIKEFVGSGDSNVQSDWNEENPTSDAYIKNKPTIPNEVTEQTVEEWGFTKNTGDYSKPSTGIPKSDLNDSVQQSLEKADKSIQSIKTVNGESLLGEGDITIKIGSNVTEETVAGWGFTKNTGDYSKPSSGIPKSDLDSNVQNSLNMANTALQEHQDISGKVDKVDGKQLSTEDFTTTLKNKLDSLSNYDDTDIKSAIDRLREVLDALVDGDTTTAIETFNEVIAFLKNVDDTQDLAGIIASIEKQIADIGKAMPTKISQLENDSDYSTRAELEVKQTKLVSGKNIKTINGQSVLGEGNIVIDTTSALLFKAKINLLSPNFNATYLNSTGNYIEFTFDTQNQDGDSIGESVMCNYTISRGGSTVQVNERYRYNQQVRFAVDKYLKEGANDILIKITGNSTGATTTVGLTFQVINLQLTSTYNISNVVNLYENPNANIEIPFEVSGTGTKTIEWYLDGVQQEYESIDEVVNTTANRTKYISMSGLSQGTHSIQARAYVVLNGEKFYSDTLYLGVIVYTTVNRDPIISIKASIPSEHGIATNGLTLYGVEQNTPYTFSFSVYNPSGAASTNADVKVGGVSQGVVSTTNGQVVDYTLRIANEGQTTLAIVAGVTTFTANVVVEKMDAVIEENNNNLVLNLYSIGRTNSDKNKSEWTSGSYVTTFEGFQWNATSGWLDNRLVISDGAFISVNYAPFASREVTENGFTFEIEFATDKVNNESAVVCDLRNSSGKGLLITANEATLTSSGDALVTTKFKSGENIRLTFVVNPSSGVTDKGLVFIYIDGILSAATNYAANDNFLSDELLKIGGSSDVAVKLKHIRIYSAALTSDDVLNNFILYRDTAAEMMAAYDRNDIMDGRVVNLDALAAQCPVVKITGNIPVLENTTSKDETIYVDVEYVNMQDPTKSFTGTHMTMKPQGTSSMGYPKKNFRLYTRKHDDTKIFDYQGYEINNRLYSFKDGAQPVDCWCFKADYAESSGTHNTGIAKLWGKAMYDAQIDGEYKLRTNAQNIANASGYPYDVRTTIDGFPCHMVYRLNESSDWVYIGKYNFNNDKSTESVFGFTGIPGFNNSRMQCWEVLNNGNHLALFEDVTNFDSEWSEAYESRYPDTKTPNTADLKAFCQWVVSTKGNVEKFKTEKWNHLDVYKAAAYYIYVMRFGAVDQTVKNSMLTSEDGVHFYWINYDNDTINGLRNDGYLVFDYLVDRQSLDPTYAASEQVYAYAGHESTLWNNMEADDEFMAIVAQVDQALYTACLKYTETIDMFDNEQSAKWCERVYNKDAQYKYVGPYNEKGTNNLFMLQGARRAHRRWWLSHRFDVIDSRFISGKFKANIVDFKVMNGTPSGQRFTIEAGNLLYYGYGVNDIPAETGVKLDKGEEYTFVTKQVLNIGDPVRIYSAQNLKKVDLSAMMSRLTQLSVTGVYDAENGSQLKELILGNGTSTNTGLAEISGLDQAKNLEVLDIRGMMSLNSVNIGSIQSLKTFLAEGSGLKSFAPADGAMLTTVTLPNTLTALTLKGLAYLNSYTISGGTRNLSTIQISECPYLTTDFNYYLNWYNSKATEDKMCTLELDNVQWNNVEPADLIRLGQLKKNGGLLRLKGKCVITDSSEEIVAQLSEIFGSNCFESSAEFFITSGDAIYLTGPDEVREGDSAQYTAAVFSEFQGRVEWSIVSGGTSYQSIDQYGLLTTKYQGSARTITIQAKHVPTQGSVVTITKQVSITKQVRPTGGTISGENYASNGVEYTLSVSPSGINTEYSVMWSLSGTAYDEGSVSIREQSKTNCILNIASGKTGSFTLTAKITDVAGNVKTVTKNINIGVKVTVYLESNQTNDSEVAALKATVQVDGVSSQSLASGSSIYVGVGSLVKVTFPTLTGYKSPNPIEFVTGEDDVVKAGTYLAEQVEVRLSSHDGGSLNGAVVKIDGTDYTWNGTPITARFAFDKEYTIQFSRVGEYFTPAKMTIKASQATRSINALYDTIPDDFVIIDQTITDPATMISGAVNSSVIQQIRAGSHRYLGKYTADGQMTLCQLSDTDGTKYADGTDAVLTGAEGDVFMKMPDFLYRGLEIGTDVWGLQFRYGSASPGAGWTKWDTNALIGVYEAYSEGEKLYSRSGVTSSGNISQENFKAYARNRGNGFRIVDWQMHCVMAILFYAQYGHTNCQDKIGNGTSSYTKQCGQTNANGMNDTKGTSPVSGLNDAGANGNSQSINFWGLENWWGNKYEWIDNVVVNSCNWEITEPDGTVRKPGKAGSSSNYITKMMFGDCCDLIPTAASGSGTTGFCDYYYQSSSSSRVVRRSYSVADTSGGVAYVDVNRDSSYTGSNSGSRLAFRGQCVEAESVATFKSLTAIG